MPFALTDDGISLAYDLHGTGEGKIKILFVMGLLSDGFAWINQIRYFSALPSYQILTYDNRGIGRSGSPFSRYTTKRMALDALCIANSVGWKEFHVVGVSMGGMISLELSLIHPDRLLSLTLIATHAGGWSGLAPWVGVKHLFSSLLASNDDERIKILLNMSYGSGTLNNSVERQRLHDLHAERLKRRIVPKVHAVISQMLAVSTHQISYRKLLKLRYSNFPVLIIVGTEDKLVQEVNSYMLAKVLGAELLVIEGAGHGLPLEHSTQVNQAIEKIIQTSNAYRPPNRISEQTREIEEEQTKEKRSNCQSRSSTSTSTNGSSSSSRYATELHALSLCCPHDSTCFEYELSGTLKGFFFGFIVRLIILPFHLPEIVKSQLPFLSIDSINHPLTVLINAGFIGGLLLGSAKTLLCIIRSIRYRRAIQNINKKIETSIRNSQTINQKENKDSNMKLKQSLLPWSSSSSASRSSSSSFSPSPSHSPSSSSSLPISVFDVVSNDEHDKRAGFPLGVDTEWPFTQSIYLIILLTATYIRLKDK